MNPQLILFIPESFSCPSKVTNFRYCRRLVWQSSSRENRLLLLLFLITHLSASSTLQSKYCRTRFPKCRNIYSRIRCFRLRLDTIAFEKPQQYCIKYLKNMLEYTTEHEMYHLKFQIAQFFGQNNTIAETAIQLYCRNYSNKNSLSYLDTAEVHIVKELKDSE